MFCFNVGMLLISLQFVLLSKFKLKGILIQLFTFTPADHDH